MARRKRKNGITIFKEIKMFNVFPVEDKGVTIDKQNVGSYIFAELGPNQPLHHGERNSPFIAEITGRDPTYRYARRFVGRSTMNGRRVNYLVRHVPKPILLDIRAQERAYYLLRTDGEPSEVTNSNILQPIKLERIMRDTVDDLLEADRIAKLPEVNPFSKSSLPDTPEIWTALKDPAAVGRAYNNAWAKLAEMQNVSESEREKAKQALVKYSEQLLEQAIHKTVAAKFTEAPVFDQSWDDDYDEDEMELAIDLPPARKPKKPKDFEKRGYIPPLAPAPGKRRINLKDLK